jgi:hypothetical protein
MAGISFDSGTIKKSRAGKALMFGVFALAAKSTQNAAEITVQHKDGNVALYTVPGKTGLHVRARIQPFLVEHGVPCLDDAPLMAAAAPAPTNSAPPSTTDGLLKLMQLRDGGALPAEEFEAQQAKLLNG